MKRTTTATPALTPRSTTTATPSLNRAIASGSPKKETLAQAGYSHVSFDKETGLHLLQDDNGGLEYWAANKNHASYGLIYGNTHLEFVSSAPARPLSRLEIKTARLNMAADELDRIKRNLANIGIHGPAEKTKTPTPAELKRLTAETEPHFFTRSSMAFFGDTMGNYGTRNAGPVQTRSGLVDCWELYRKRPVKHGLRDSAYFCKSTFRRVFPETK